MTSPTANTENFNPNLRWHIHEHHLPTFFPELSYLLREHAEGPAQLQEQDNRHATGPGPPPNATVGAAHIRDRWAPADNMIGTGRPGPRHIPGRPAPARTNLPPEPAQVHGTHPYGYLPEPTRAGLATQASRQEQRIVPAVALTSPGFTSGGIPRKGMDAATGVHSLHKTRPGATAPAPAARVRARASLASATREDAGDHHGGC